MGGFFANAFQQWLGRGEQILAAASKLDACASGQCGMVQVTMFDNEDDGGRDVFVAGAVFEDEKSAQEFLTALIDMMATVEGEHE